MSERIIAAADGAAKGNPGRAGWGWVVADADERPVRWAAGPLGHSTNNVGELTALLELLRAVPADADLQVRMDSQYAMKAVTQWLPNWKRNGWKTAAGKPVANRELVQAIDELLTGRTVEFRYVPAHREDGDHLNAIADKAASDAAQHQRAAGTEHGDDLPVPDPVTAGSAPKSRPAAKTGARKAPTGGAKASGGTKTSGGGRPTLNAKFPGRCPCGQPYPAGEKITRIGTRWGHLACADTLESPED
ncbi:ribonuclease H family protein (plasmid) [Streptomyces sp. BI20]|uniref:ribonuclease H family protein n=1 Tax=Streptomyces sp. BI20 TaxID=3403460 RepID=UPI003C760591